MTALRWLSSLLSLLAAPFRALEREGRERVNPFRFTDADHVRASLAADLATVTYGPSHPNYRGQS